MTNFIRAGFSLLFGAAGTIGFLSGIIYGMVEAIPYGPPTGDPHWLWPSMIVSGALLLAISYGLWPRKRYNRRIRPRLTA